MVMRPPMLPNFSSPNVSHTALMRMFIFPTRNTTIVAYSCLKGFYKPFKYLICIIASAINKRRWKPKINSKCKDTRMLLKSTINRSMQPFQILTYERPFIYLNRQATIAKLIMDNKITILTMTQHVKYSNA